MAKEKKSFSFQFLTRDCREDLVEFAVDSLLNLEQFILSQATFLENCMLRGFQLECHVVSLAVDPWFPLALVLLRSGCPRHTEQGALRLVSLVDCFCRCLEVI